MTSLTNKKDKIRILSIRNFGNKICFFSSRVLKFLKYISSADLIFSVLITFILFIISIPTIIYGWWTRDDPILLLIVAKYKPWNLLFKPEIWQKISSIHFTPWANISLYIDLILFGLQPKLFYIHQAIVYSILGLLTYFLLRNWCNYFLSFVFSLMIVLSPPIYSSFQYLWIRHYIEGLLFSIFSLSAFLKYIKIQKKKWLIICIFCYILASISKEIYIPLILLYIFYPWKESFRDRISFLLVALVICFWRLYIFGVGYSYYSSLNLSHLFDFMLQLPRASFKALCFSKDLSLIMLVIYFLSIAFFLKTKKMSVIKFFALSILLLILIYIPIYPVGNIFLWLVSDPNISINLHYHLRYFVLVSFIFIATLAIMLGISFNRHNILAFFVLPFLVYNIYLDTLIFHNAKEKVLMPYKTISNFLLHGGGDKVFVHSFEDVTYPFSSLLALYDYLGKLSIKDIPYYCVDPCLCFQKIPKNLSTYVFDGYSIKKTFVKCNKKDGILTPQISYNHGIVYWKFGPYKEGKYCLLFIKSNDEGYFPQKFYPIGLVCLPREGKLKFKIYSQSLAILRFSSKERCNIYYNYPISLKPNKIEIKTENIENILKSF